MNTFKTVVMICVLLGASCSGQYMGQSSNNQAAQGGSSASGGMMAGQSSYSAQIQQGSLNSPAASPAFAPEQSRPSVGPVMPAAPTTSQQICSCITINPAASAHQSAPVASFAAESSGQAAAHGTEQQQQTFSAPVAAQQQSFAGQSAPAQSYSSAAATHQSAAAQPAY